MKEKNEKISMEKYFEFFASHKQSYLKIEFLNQIISMHGFKRLKLPKSALSDAVSTIDLMNPSRSTLTENIAPAESMTLNDVMEDLNDLTWQECCVTSIKTLNSLQTEAKQNDDNKKKKKKKEEKKKNKLSVAAEVSKPSQDHISLSASTTSLYAGCEVCEEPKQSIPKRKRSAPGGTGSSLL